MNFLGYIIYFTYGINNSVEGNLLETEDDSKRTSSTAASPMDLATIKNGHKEEYYKYVAPDY